MNACVDEKSFPPYFGSSTNANESDPLFQLPLVMDRLLTMTNQEATYRINDYLSTISPSDTTVDTWCRFKMVEWCYQVIDRAEFRRETASIAINYLDRYLSISSTKVQSILYDRSKYQLCAMTCLFIAIKLNETKMLDTNLMSQLSRDCYSKQDFISMEMDIVTELNWYLNGPTPISFMEHYLALLPLYRSELEVNQTTIAENARHQIEVSVGEYSLMTTPPSMVAVAALVNSVRMVASVQEDRLIGDDARVLKVIENISGINIRCPSLIKLSQALRGLTNGVSLNTDQVCTHNDLFTNYFDHSMDTSPRSSTQLFSSIKCDRYLWPHSSI
jgi:hypothetical protein